MSFLYGEDDLALLLCLEPLHEQNTVALAMVSPDYCTVLGQQAVDDKVLGSVVEDLLRRQAEEQAASDVLRIG